MENKFERIAEIASRLFLFLFLFKGNGNVDTRALHFWKGVDKIKYYKMKLNIFVDFKNFILIIILFLNCSNNNESSKNTDSCQFLSSNNINEIITKLEPCIYNKPAYYNVDDLLMQYSQKGCFSTTNLSGECDSSLSGNKFLIFDAYEQNSCIKYFAPVTHVDFLFAEDKFTAEEGPICMTGITKGTNISMIRRGYRRGCKFFMDNIIEYCQDGSINFIKFTPPLAGFISKDKSLSYIIPRAEKFCYKRFPPGSMEVELNNFDCEPIGQTEPYKGCYLSLSSTQSECYTCIREAGLCAER